MTQDRTIPQLGVDGMLQENLPQRIDTSSGLSIWVRSNSDQQGPLPGLLYLALSGSDSLLLDPYNQPVEFALQQPLPLRVYSFSLPGHEDNLNPHNAMDWWASHYAQGQDPLGLFLKQLRANVDYLVESGWLDGTKTAIAGLSRGGLLASLASANDARLNPLLAYAPLVDLRMLSEFDSIKNGSLISSYALENVSEGLADRKLRFYVGNRDMRVSTDAVYKTVRNITEIAFAQRKKGTAELVITPSIGHKGHGTSKTIFQEGIHWILQQWI